MNSRPKNHSTHRLWYTGKERLALCVARALECLIFVDGKKFNIIQQLGLLPEVHELHSLQAVETRHLSCGVRHVTLDYGARWRGFRCETQKLILTKGTYDVRTGLCSLHDLFFPGKNLPCADGHVW